MKNSWEKIFIVVIFTLALIYRLYGLSLNTPFWVDEFYTASQARLVQLFGLSVFRQPGIYFEFHNISTHFLVAAFFDIFGRQEWVARLPFAIIGSLVPVTVYYLAKKLFNTSTSIAATLLTIFSYFQITWSRQARGYMLQQLLILIAFYLYYVLLDKKKKNPLIIILFLIISLLGFLTHITFIILLLSLGIHFFRSNRSNLTRLMLNPLFFVGILILYLISYYVGVLNIINEFFKNRSFGASNVWYYHSFLWREYGLITFLAVCGIIFGLLNKKKEISGIIIYLFLFLFFLSFIFKPYVSRYLAPIFPFLFIFASHSLYQLSQNIKLPFSLNKFKLIIPIFLSLFIIINGHKFVNKPKKFYSVNHDFREAALIDYSQIYSKIKETNLNLKSKSVVIDTLPDRAQWYLGYDYNPLYLLRGGNLAGFTHGIARKTNYKINNKGEKVIGQDQGVVLIADLPDLKRILAKFPMGFIFIDDSALPREIIDYAEKNLTKEIYLDHYPLDENPYSIWPATLYSWGVGVK